MSIFHSILNILFPPHCVSCKQEGDFLCKNCVQKLDTKVIKRKSVYPSYLDFKHLDGLIYGLDYAKNSQIQSAIRQFKYKFTKDLVNCFSDLMSQKMNELNMLNKKDSVLIPVPLHKKRLHYRGFNQADLLAKSTQKYYGKRASVHHLLLRVKNTSQQAKLTKKERHLNLENAFKIKGDLSVLSEKVCFLVDDVCTTGATLDNCARILKEAGVKKVYGLVVARAFK